MDAYTVVITSCRRFDLLVPTLRGLSQHLDGNLQEIVIAEDSGCDEVYDAVKEAGVTARVLLNRPQLGQLASIDRAYSTVRTPYIFHCEDDWDFIRGGFVTPSIELLKAFPKISMVSLRPREELNKRHQKEPLRTWNGIEYIAADPASHPEYFGYSFNPGMRRREDYFRFGPFKDYRGEREVSYCFKQLGYYMVALQPAAVRHTGWDRHIDDPNDILRAKDFTTRLTHSAKLRIRRMKRFLFPKLDPGYQLKTGQGKFAESRLQASRPVPPEAA